MKKLLILIFILSSVYANDNNQTNTEDDFDTLFKKTFQKKHKHKKKHKKKHKHNYTKKYFISTSRNIKLRSYYFFKKTNYQYRTNEQLYSDFLIEINSKIRSENYITSLSIFGMLGTDDNTYSYEKIMLNEFRDTDNDIPILGIKEFYMIKTNNNHDFIIGKKIFKPGLSTIYSPANIYDTVIAPDPLDPYTIGVWLTKFNYYINNNSSYSIIFMPFISKAKTASVLSRWSGNYYQNNYYDSFDDVNGTVKEDTNNHIRIALQYKNSIHNVDTSFIVGYGPSLYKILEYTATKDTYLLTSPSVVYISTGFSTTYNQFEFHGEAYYQNTLNGEDDNFISSVIGTTYTLDKWIDNININKIITTIEFTKIFVTKKYNSDKTYKSSEEIREPKKDILVKINAQINYKLAIKYLADFRLSIGNNKDGGYYQKIGTSYMFKDNLKGDVYLEFFNGEENSFYKKWSDNNRIIFQLEYSF